MLARRERFLSTVLGFSTFCLIVASGMSAFAQPRPGGGGGGFGFGGGGLGLLRNENVKKELELTDDQNEQIKTVTDKMGEEMRGLFTAGGGGDQEARREKMQTLTADAQKQIDKILLPNQTKRLKQLEFQQRMSFGGPSGTALTSDSAVEALSITDDQKETLTAKAKEVNAELQKKTAKLRQEAQQKLLDTLTPEQRAKWKELAGEQFDFGPMGGFGGGGFGVGAGGPGGGRPGAGAGGGGQGGRRPGGNRPQQ